MPDRRSTNFVKSTVFFYLARLLLLCRVLYTISFTILSLPVFLMVSLKKKYCYFYLSMIPTSSLESNFFYHILTEKKRFLDVLARGELIKGYNSQKTVYL